MYWQSYPLGTSFVGRTFRSDNAGDPEKGFQALKCQGLKPPMLLKSYVGTKARTHKPSRANCDFEDEKIREKN